MRVASKPRSTLPFALPLQHSTVKHCALTVCAGSTLLPKEIRVSIKCTSPLGALDVNENRARGTCICCKAIEHVFIKCSIATDAVARGPEQRDYVFFPPFSSLTFQSLFIHSSNMFSDFFCMGNCPCVARKVLRVSIALEMWDLKAKWEGRASS